MAYLQPFKDSKEGFSTGNPTWIRIPNDFMTLVDLIAIIPEQLPYFRFTNDYIVQQSKPVPGTCDILCHFVSLVVMLFCSNSLLFFVQKKHQFPWKLSSPTSLRYNVPGRGDVPPWLGFNGARIGMGPS